MSADVTDHLPMTPATAALIADIEAAWADTDQARLVLRPRRRPVADTVASTPVRVMLSMGRNLLPSR